MMNGESTRAGGRAGRIEKPMIEGRIELHGHVIDSLILPRTLDEIVDHGAEYEIERFEVGKRNEDPSHVCIRLQAPDSATLDGLLDVLQRLGAQVPEERDARTEAAPMDGAFPDTFYSTTNMRTQVRLNGRWVPVAGPEMDCGILIEGETARTIPMGEVRAGDRLVVGREGVRVQPVERERTRQAFEFMGSDVSSERPKALAIEEIASYIRAVKERGGKVLVVGGPAVVHTNAVGAMSGLIMDGWVDVLFAGNALATHDLEFALFKTSLGVYLEKGSPAEGGHEHHLRAINKIRLAGGIAAAVEKGLVTSGVMHAVVKKGIDYVLAGSIRDDGPLPEVITDVIEAQKAMREQLKGVEVCLIVASMLHGIAVGNLMPAEVKTVCVDINPSVVTKLLDRGSFQTVGLVTDVDAFLRGLHASLSR
jgi:lysine-ketoglutarate reductase/saccharopine dehydrogenase-like protein (TIGR00300 family)